MKKIFAIVFLIASAARADDAPQFRGDLGISKETGLPTTWSGSDGLRWTADLPGKGLSNPVIAGGRVYVSATSAYQQKREVVLCFDAKSGKKLWERQVWGTGTTLCHPKTNMAAPTPITDGERVYALFATGDFVCYDKDGDLVWYRSLVGDYPTVGNNVGMAASPTIWNDLILVSMENAGESFAAGIDKRTGENRWRVQRPRGIHWSTPVIVQNKDQADLVCQGGGDITGYDPNTGKKKWSFTSASFSRYTSPTTGAGIVYAAGEKFVALKPGSPTKEPAIVWQSLKLKPGSCSPIAHQGFVYVVTNNGVVNCADVKTGDIVWTHRLEAGAIAASPMLAEGRLYVLHEKGATSVLQLGSEPKLLGVNKIDDTFLATPVASDRAIFLRSDTKLYCVGKK